MLTIIAALALAIQPTPSDPLDEKCGVIGDIAESIMVARQANAPMSQSMKGALRAAPQDWHDMLREMVKSAYDKPAYYTPVAKAEEVMRFRNEWEAACYRDLAAK